MAHPRSDSGPARRSRRQRLTAAGGAVAIATAGLLATAPPAAAQAAAQDVTGASAGSALRLTVNLPGGEQTQVNLLVSPVTGQVSTTGGASPEALAVASSLNSESGLLAQLFDAASPLRNESRAQLPEPTSVDNDQAAALAEGLAGTPLAGLLGLSIAPTTADVSTDPSSTSRAGVVGVQVGLPSDIADALAPLTEPLSAGLDELLTQIGDNLPALTGPICDAAGGGGGGGLPTGQLQDAIDEVLGLLGGVSAGESNSIRPAVPTLSGLLGAGSPDQPAPAELRASSFDVAAAGPEDIAQALLDLLGGLTEGDIPVLCSLSDTLDRLNTALQDALATLTGPGGVLNVSGIESTQSITRSAEGLTSTATTQIAALRLLGQTPFADVEVLRTTSTATATGAPGGATATVDSTIAGIQGGAVDPFAQVRATIQGITGDLLGLDLDPLDTIIADILDTLNAALAPIGITVLALDDSPSATALDSCPDVITAALSGTFAAEDGACAAAATRGVGIEITLPEELAGPLTIEGPLLSLQIVPSAAVAAIVPIAPVPAPAPGPLPRTGLDSALLGLTGLALILGVAMLRRRTAVV